MYHQQSGGWLMTFFFFFLDARFDTLAGKLLQGVWWEILWGYREIGLDGSEWQPWGRTHGTSGEWSFLWGENWGSHHLFFEKFLWRVCFLWEYPTCFSQLFGNGWWLFCYFVGHFNLEFVLGTSKKRTSSESVWSNYSDFTQPHPKM